jgi:hypothetical protein
VLVLPRGGCPGVGDGAVVRHVRGETLAQRGIADRRHPSLQFGMGPGQQFGGTRVAGLCQYPMTQLLAGQVAEHSVATDTWG